MTVISAKEFNARQNHFMRMARRGEHVMVRSRGGNYHLTFEPSITASSQDKEPERDITAEVCQAMKDWRDFLDGDESKMLSWEEMLHDVQD
jgi:hypothetical protein